MSVNVSIVLSCYKRGAQLRRTLQSIVEQDYPAEIIVVEDGNDGVTETIAKSFGARYYRKPRTDLPAFQNPSRVHNIGIQRASGSVVVLQGGEVMFETKPSGLRQLVEPVLLNPNLATTPSVQALDREGKHSEWLTAPKDCPRAGWIINFCLTVSKNRLMKIGGFEESYTGYGHEDDQLMYSLRRIGVTPTYVPVLASHQWHERENYAFENEEGKAKFGNFILDVEHFGRAPVANYGREWGKL